MPRYYFHKADGQRTIDPVGMALDSEGQAQLEAVSRAAQWIGGDPAMVVNQECRVEVSLADNVVMFTVMMFSVDPRSFGKSSS